MRLQSNSASVGYFSSHKTSLPHISLKSHLTLSESLFLCLKSNPYKSFQCHFSLFLYSYASRILHSYWKQRGFETTNGCIPGLKLYTRVLNYYAEDNSSSGTRFFLSWLISTKTSC